MSPGQEKAVSEAEEEKKALIRRLLEAYATGDLDTLDELLAPDYVDHNPQPDQVPDREGFIQSVARHESAFSDTRVTTEYQAVDGDLVISRFTMNHVHDRGEFMGMEPTGRSWETSAIVIHRIEGGRIAEEWSESSNQLEATRQRLEREKFALERVEQELHVARRIQHASLPEEVPRLEGWWISPYYRPAREVGGDFYDFIDLEDGRVGVVVGDATGKGVPAALVVTATHSMLRAVAQTLGSSSPGEILEQVNETLLARIPENMFVTCFYAILDPASGTLGYANAGHDPPYLRRFTGEVEELRARGMPLGLMSGMSYEEGEVFLREADSVIFYSDGLVEAHDPRGMMFGFPRLRALVAEHGEESSPGNSLLDDLYSFVGEGWEQEDDITLLTLRRTSPPG
jgi:serine phosphatase RsbU (regulator of sigma subunit)/ketosteroid isomerase-like protein